MGGGGARYSEPASPSLRERLKKARDEERARLQHDVEDYLANVLSRYNARNRSAIRDRLEELQELLKEEATIDRTLYGGSVAKHTDVDGLSDTDALVLLNIKTGQGVSPQAVLEKFRERLDVVLPRAEVQDVGTGRLAVTVTYRDGEQLQLLPAVELEGHFKIPNSSGSGWSTIDPIAFQKRLTSANEANGRNLVPAIKLIKGIIARLPENRQLKSHHVETLAVDSVQGYEGPNRPQDLVLHILEHSANRVLQPMPDVTGQSRSVDEYLGPPNGETRRRISLALDGLQRRLGDARSVGDWRSLLGE